jgi:hypothetical protein
VKRWESESEMIITIHSKKSLNLLWFFHTILAVVVMKLKSLLKKVMKLKIQIGFAKHNNSSYYFSYIFFEYLKCFYIVLQTLLKYYNSYKL